MRTLISSAKRSIGQAEGWRVVERKIRRSDEGQRDDVRRVFERGAGTWDKRVRARSVDALTLAFDGCSRYAAPEHEV